MSEQDRKIVNLGGLKKFKEHYDTDIITPINNKIDSKTNVQSGETITTNNDTIGYFKDIKINGNTRYKKSNGTYTDTWESGVSLESMGEKEKNSNGKYPVEVVSCGKNLFSTELFEKISLNENCNLCSWNEDTGVLHLSWNGVKTSLTLLTSQKIKKNTQYTLSFEIQGKQSWLPNTIRIEYTDGTESFSRTTLDSTTEYKKIILISDVNKTISRIYWMGVNVSNVKNLQLEEGTIATNYEPYKEDKRTVLLDSPLRKVGTIADVLDLGKSQVIRKSHKIVLDNNIGGYETNSKNGKKGYNITLSKKAKDGKLICDKLPVVNEYIVWEETIGIYIKNNEIIIYHNGESLTDFKTWLASNPITVVYELATPTTEDIQISPTDNPLTSYTPSTTLTTNNTIKGNISADMPTNVANIITQQASAIASLQDTVLETQSALIESEYSNLI
ncbi:MAG: hypothetical protein SPI06_04700 [Terrisporobacter sp.]|uniref:hypothetical protein n=1 Tax=Terrisporobacter sp. TaxID=1965305 RepID=UPI002A90CC3F|nr:hypothetical protein [Terrisporobacter sp.]MDY6152691.1 hypothetical protein [Terrisporobacter sp.]